MKWKTGFVLVLVVLAVVPLGVESVSGMESEWEYELWSDVTELSVSDAGLMDDIEVWTYTVGKSIEQGKIKIIRTPKESWYLTYMVGDEK
jgi:hypothetical protein